MRYSKFSKTCSIGLLFIVLVIVVSFSYPLIGDEPHILVTLRDKSVQKFRYDSFSFNWFLPQIKEELTCKMFEFNTSDLVEIYVLNQTLNSCDQKDDWLFDVYLKDQNPIQGFFELSGDGVSGKDYDTGEEKSIPFKDIFKVNYR